LLDFFKFQQLFLHSIDGRKSTVFDKPFLFGFLFAPAADLNHEIERLITLGGSSRVFGHS